MSIDDHSSSAPRSRIYTIESYRSEEALSVQLRGCLNKITEAIDTALSGTGLSSQLFGALHAIFQGNAKTPSELARLRYQEPAAISYTLNVLEKKSLIKRLPGATDRRIVRLQLTPKGEALTRDCIPVVIEAQNDALAPLDLEDYMVLQGLLRKLTD